MHAHRISCTCFYTCFTYLLSRLELICNNTYVGALTTLLYRLYPYSYIFFTKAHCGTKFTCYKAVNASIDAAFIFCTLKYISHYFEIPQRCISIYIFRNMKSKINRNRNHNAPARILLLLKISLKSQSPNTTCLRIFPIHLINRIPQNISIIESRSKFSQALNFDRASKHTCYSRNGSTSISYCDNTRCLSCIF